jgi:hypothetical protein
MLHENTACMGLFDGAPSDAQNEGQTCIAAAGSLKRGAFVLGGLPDLLNPPHETRLLCFVVCSADECCAGAGGGGASIGGGAVGGF